LPVSLVNGLGEAQAESGWIELSKFLRQTTDRVRTAVDEQVSDQEPHVDVSQLWSAVVQEPVSTPVRS
jgi:hypothetical protein